VLRMKERLFLGTWYVINVTMAFEILKGCYFGRSNLIFIAVGRKVQLFAQEYVIHKVSRCGHGKYKLVCYCNWQLVVRDGNSIFSINSVIAEVLKINFGRKSVDMR
jgi:hypothetical protein